MSVAAFDSQGEEIIVPCDANCLERVRLFVKDQALSAGFDRRAINHFVLAADEACSNMIKHSYRFDPNHKLVVGWRQSEETAVVEIRDDSPIPYLPSTTDFDIPSKIKYGHTEGYGKYLLRNAVDDVQYETVPGSHNKISLVKFRDHKNPERDQELSISPYTIARGRALSLVALFDAWEGIQAQESRDEIIRLFLYSIMGRLAAQPVALLMTDATGDYYEVIGQVGLSQRLVLNKIKFPRNGRVAETLWAHKAPFLADEFQSLDISPEEQQTLTHLRSAILLPIVVLGHLRGILALGEKRGKQSFNEDEMRYANLLSSHVVMLLESQEAPFSQSTEKAIESGFRAAIRGAIARLTPTARDNNIEIQLDEGPVALESSTDTQLVQNIALSLLTHVVYLAGEGDPIEVKLDDHGGAQLKISYHGREISFEKGEEGYNPLIDQLLTKNLRLGECYKAVQLEGGSLRVEATAANGSSDSQDVIIHLTLPLKK